MKNVFVYAAALMAASFFLQARATRPARLAGTVVAIRAEPFEIQVKDDAGRETAAKLDAETQFRKVEPGERDLRHAKVLQVSALSPSSGRSAASSIEPDRSRDSGGAGGSLAIAQRAIRLHNGRIRPASAYPGLEVVITLPV